MHTKPQAGGKFTHATTQPLHHRRSHSTHSAAKPATVPMTHSTPQLAMNRTRSLAPPVPIEANRSTSVPRPSISPSTPNITRPTAAHKATSTAKEVRAVSMPKPRPISASPVFHGEANVSNMGGVPFSGLPPPIVTNPLMISDDDLERMVMEEIEMQTTGKKLVGVPRSAGDVTVKRLRSSAGSDDPDKDDLQLATIENIETRFLSIVLKILEDLGQVSTALHHVKLSPESSEGATQDETDMRMKDTMLVMAELTPVLRGTSRKMEVIWGDSAKRVPASPLVPPSSLRLVDGVGVATIPDLNTRNRDPKVANFSETLPLGSPPPARALAGKVTQQQYDQALAYAAQQQQALMQIIASLPQAHT